MVTTIRLSKDIQRQLKLRSAETGISQLELANRFISEGLKKDYNQKKDSSNSLEEYDKLLAHDKKEGNNLKKFANLVTTPFAIDEVVEKKGVYRGVIKNDVRR